MIDPEEILEALARLRRLDGQRSLFGSRYHDYRLNPCLSDKDILAVEERYNVTFPEEYRIFLAKVGNGGAGPAYGIFRLGEEDDGFGFTSWEKGVLLGDPSKPFTHRDKWNLPESFWATMPDDESMGREESDKAYEAWDRRLEKLYWDPAIMNGAIPICHLGCAIREWLVVSGPEIANVWQDDRANRNGIYPLLSDDGARVTFSHWYMGWLRESLKSIEG